MLKDLPNAPKSLIVRLAQDTDIAVSEPIIRRSPLLAAEDLLALLAAPPAPQTVCAVARRPHLPRRVADAVAAKTEAAAVQALLGTHSTAIREATLDSLVAHSAHHCAWHETLAQRSAPAPKTARAPAAADVVATHLLQILAARTDFGAELTAQLRDKLAMQLRADASAEDIPERLTPDEANARARLMQACGKLNEETLLQAAQRGEARLVSALLALAADMPFAAVDRAASLRSAKGLVSLCWKAGYGMRLAEPLQSLLCRIPPREVLRAAADGTYPLAASEMLWQIEFLGRSGR